MNFFKRHRVIKVEIPIGWRNCAITHDNFFIADTNDSAMWDTLKFPLPKPKYKWNIKSYKLDNKIVELIDKP